MFSKVWGEITHPFLNFNGATIEVYEWISNFIPHFTDYLSMLGLKLNLISKRGPRRHCRLVTFWDQTDEHQIIYTFAFTWQWDQASMLTIKPLIKTDNILLLPYGIDSKTRLDIKRYCSLQFIAVTECLLTLSVSSLCATKYVINPDSLAYTFP